MNVIEEYGLRHSGAVSLFEDNQGVLLTPEELDELSAWEIEERQIRVSEL